MHKIERVSLTWLGVLPGYEESIATGVSTGGSLVVGYVSSATLGRRAFRWTPETGMQDLGTLGGTSSQANGVSTDGAVIVGWAIDNKGLKRAVRWTGAGRVEHIGETEDEESEALAISADGQVIVGWVRRNGSQLAFRWTAQTGLKVLAPDNHKSSVACGVSGDGTVVVGTLDYTDSDKRAFLWTENAGIIELTSTGIQSEALAVSRDGKTIVGKLLVKTPSGDPFVHERGQVESFTEAPFVYKRGQDKIRQLSDHRGVAKSVSGDGNWVVGWLLSSTAKKHACYWGPRNYLRVLDKLYAPLLEQDSSLISVESVSYDGCWAVGIGYNAATQRKEAFLAEVEIVPRSRHISTTSGTASRESKKIQQTPSYHNHDSSTQAIATAQNSVSFKKEISNWEEQIASLESAISSWTQKYPEQLQKTYQIIQSYKKEAISTFNTNYDDSFAQIKSYKNAIERFFSESSKTCNALQSDLENNRSALKNKIERVKSLVQAESQRLITIHFNNVEKELNVYAQLLRSWMNDNQFDNPRLPIGYPTPTQKAVSFLPVIKQLEEIVKDRNRDCQDRLSYYESLTDFWTNYGWIVGGLFILGLCLSLRGSDICTAITVLLVLALLFTAAITISASSSLNQSVQNHKSKIFTKCQQILDMIAELNQKLSNDRSALEIEVERLMKMIYNLENTANNLYKTQLQEYEKLKQSYLSAWSEVTKLIPDWDEPATASWASPCWNDWRCASAIPNAIRIGTQTFRPSETSKISIPAFEFPHLLNVFYSQEKSNILFSKDSPKGQEVLRNAVLALCYRFLAVIPPGKLRFTFIDPIGMGDSVASLMDLKDYDETVEDSFVSSRAWSETEQIRKQLENLKNHIATVIQERLRDKYPTIEDYNREVGDIAEPYRILCIFDFPYNFDTTALDHLLSIVRSGPRCGVITLITTAPSFQLPYGGENIIAEIKKYVNTFEVRNDNTVKMNGNWAFYLDTPPPSELGQRILHEWGRQAREGARVEVPFEKVLQIASLSRERRWQEDSRNGLSVPLGPVGARSLQYLELGKGTMNHALVVGRTGSGKSNLLHVLITAASLIYPPSELRLYLIDLKTVEFVIYRNLPHAEVVAVDADREYALSVLDAVYNELLLRQEKFKKFAANDLAEYREKSEDNMPRILLLIDEFQVLFEYDDIIAVEANRILDRVVRQGRAFGIHVLLGSQSLANRTLPRSTLDQMAVRIALQCSDADSRLILAEDNGAARRLRRPGEAIYNSANGLIEGNSQFQVAFFSDSDRDRYLDELASLAERAAMKQKPVVFEGNEPAHLEKCRTLIEMFHNRVNDKPRVAKALIGEPVAVKPTVAVSFSRRSGSHLAIVTREEEEGVGMALSSAISLFAQYPSDRVSLFIVNYATADSLCAELPNIIVENLPHNFQLVERRQLPELFARLERARTAAIEENETLQKDIYLVLLGLHRIRDLRQTEDFYMMSSFSENSKPNLNKIMTDLLRDGPEIGIHFILWCDTVGNLKRVLDRRSLNEIGFRVAGSMSDQDSSELIDSNAAGRIDKPHRAILYDDDQPGVLTKFRPFTVHSADWLRELVTSIKTVSSD